MAIKYNIRILKFWRLQLFRFMITVEFLLNSILLGVGLAMDAFSVSLTDGLNDHAMKPSKMNLVAGMFGVFQGLMPLIGWICVHTVLVYFNAFSAIIPYIALFLLAYIGGKMIYEGVKSTDDDNGQSGAKLTLSVLILQAIATSIDALSVGFTIASYEFPLALLCTIIIGFLTYVICLLGVYLGKKFGAMFSHKAEIFGGIILIIVGLEIFIKGVFL